MTTSAPPALRLSDLAGRIDMKSFYESHGCIVSGKPTNSQRDGKEFAASCCRCGGTDRFSFWESGRFNCVRGCGWHGSSPYFFLRDEGYSHVQALEELGIDPEEVGDSYSQSAPKLPLWLVKDDAPSKKWQDAAAAFCRAAEHCLRGPKGETARAYLHSRGLKDETIRAAHLGLCPDWYKAPLEDWGLSPEQLDRAEDPQIKIPRGIVIPWFVGGDIWKIQLRRPDGGYFQVLGSSDCLYSLVPIEPGKPILLEESEFDALSSHQEASDLINSVATGSTTKARTNKWIACLKQASTVLQSFDDDPAGETGAAEWQKVLPNCYRWAPWSHDVNDMLKEDHDIKLWVETGLQINQVELAPPEAMAEILFSLEDAHKPTEQGENREALFDTLVQQQAERLHVNIPPALDKNGKPIPPELAERVVAFQRRPCTSCGGHDWMVDVDGLLVCPCIEEKRRLNALPRPALVLPTPTKQSSFQGYWKQ